MNENITTALYWEYDSRIGRRWNMDPKGAVSESPYLTFNGNPISNIDSKGDVSKKPDDWVQTKDGKTVWDDRVNNQANATSLYGDGATYRAPGYNYKTSEGSVTLGTNRQFTVNGSAKTAVNSTPQTGNFSEWNAANGGGYGSQLEAYRAWRDNPNYHAGESWLDKFARNVNSAHIEIMRDEGSGGGMMFGGFGNSAKAVSSTAAETHALDGSFSIWNWKGYPSGIPKPNGPFRIIAGEEYGAARAAGNDANRAISGDLGLRNTLVDIHEVVPIKFGGSPTNINNKVFLERSFHQQQVTPFWNMIMRSMK